MTLMTRIGLSSMKPVNSMSMADYQKTTSKSRTSKSEEHDIQVAICQLLDYYKVDYFAVPNGMFLNFGKDDDDKATKDFKAMLYMKKMKEEGFKPGVCDLVLLFPKEAVFVENKTSIGKQSDKQVDFQTLVESLGFTYLIWRSVDDCERYLKGRIK